MSRNFRVRPVHWSPSHIDLLDNEYSRESRIGPLRHPLPQIDPDYLDS